MGKKKEEDLIDALSRAVKKKAMGYVSVETVEEYACSDGELVLQKRKIKKTDVPPDVSAVKLMLEISTLLQDDMTEEEVKKEKERLIRLLTEVENETDKNKDKG
jgi:hypothetical protein